MIYFLPAFTLGFVAGLALSLLALAASTEKVPLRRIDIGEPELVSDYEYAC